MRTRSSKRLPFVLRLAFAWGRWAAQHPAVAITVYVLELLVGPTLLWLAGAGLITALIVLALEASGLVALSLAVRRRRRLSGLPPLPPLWRKQTPPRQGS